MSSFSDHADSDSEGQKYAGQERLEHIRKIPSDEEPLYCARLNVLYRLVVGAIVFVVERFSIDAIWSLITGYESFLWCERFRQDPYVMAAWLVAELFLWTVGMLFAVAFVIGWIMPLYAAHTYRVNIYTDRIAQHSQLLPGVENPLRRRGGTQTLALNRVRKVNIGNADTPGSLIDFYVQGRASPFMYIADTVGNHHMLISALLDVLPDHVEVVGDQELISRYRDGEEFSWWKKMFIG